jgi:dTDP-4-dehydrorhamnose reductase
VSAIAILGAQGQVGRALALELKRQGRFVYAFSQEQADLTSPKAVVQLLGHANPSAVINAAAYTAVDQAEREEEQAFRINAEAPGTIAQWCARRGIPFVHYSTDYVFSGEGSKPWREDDPKGPLSVYGRSKLAGEEAVTKAGGSSLILRTSWVYDADGKNFLNTMLKLGAEREEFRVVADQVGAPTFAGHLATATLEALDRAAAMKVFPSGVYHACAAGETNWREFAQSIFEEAHRRELALKVKVVTPILTAEYPTPAKRPLNSRLDMHRLFEVFDVKLPEWQVGLKACMAEKTGLRK